MQWPSTDRDTKIVDHVSYNRLAPRMSAFLMRDMNKAFAETTRSQSQQWSWLWSGSPMCLPSYGPNLYFAKMKELVSLYLTDIIICVIVTLLNDNWHFFINGCGRWLFLEVNLYCFYSLGSWLLVVSRS